MKTHIPSRASHSGAFALIEVSLALGITGFALVAILGLLPIGLDSNRNSAAQTVAANIATQIEGDLRTSGTLAQSIRYGILMTGTSQVYLDQTGVLLPNSQNCRYRATTSFLSATGRQAVCGTVKITWPGQAAPTNSSGSLTAFVALNRN